MSRRAQLLPNLPGRTIPPGPVVRGELSCCGGRCAGRRHLEYDSEKKWHDVRVEGHAGEALDLLECVLPI